MTSSTPPGWATQVPSAPVQLPPAKAKQITPPSTQQVQAMQQQLLQAIWQGFLLIVDGFLNPGAQPSDQLAQWAQGFTQLKADAAAKQAARQTYNAAVVAALAAGGGWSTEITAIDSARQTYLATMDDIDASEVFTLRSIISSLFGLDTSGRIGQANVQSGTGGSTLADDWMKVTNFWSNLFGAGNDPTTTAVKSSAVQKLDAFWDNLVGSGNDPTTAKVQPASVASLYGNSDIGADFADHINYVVQNLLGLPGTATLDQANQAYTVLQGTVSGLAVVTQALQQQQSQALQGGENYSVDFSRYATGSFSTAPFNVTYTGSGTGGLVISGGNAAWSSVNDGDVTATAIFNGGTMGTDYPLLRATVAGIPGYYNGGGTSASNWCFLRSNSAGDTFVYAKVYSTGSFSVEGEIGCFVSGVQTVFMTGIALTYNLNFTVSAGDYDSSNLYRIQAWSGSTQVVDYTDSSHVSQYGSSYRYWGFISETTDNGVKVPAPASFVGCLDNAPAAATGSGFVTTNTSTTNVTTSAGLMPSSFYNDLVTITSDLSYNASINEITFTYGGWYHVTIAVLMASTAGGGQAVSAVLYHNGAIYEVGNTRASTANYTISASFDIFVSPGDTIQAGLANTGSTPITGESTGTQCYFTGTRTGPWPMAPLTIGS